MAGQVAQLVEQGTENPRVGGSIPSLATILFRISESLTKLLHGGGWVTHGGSIPSLATILFRISESLTKLLHGGGWVTHGGLRWATLGLVLLLGGCQPDHCDQLCQQMSTELARCLDEWEAADWDELDAESQTTWRSGCQNRWSEVRSELESRELEDALEQCGETLTAVDDMGAYTCDQLRAIYIR